MGPSLFAQAAMPIHAPPAQFYRPPSVEDVAKPFELPRPGSLQMLNSPVSLNGSVEVLTTPADPITSTNGIHVLSNGSTIQIQAHLPSQSCTDLPKTPTKDSKATLVDIVNSCATKREAASFLRADVLREAEEILRKNDYGGYTVPTEGLYPYQWNWDSALVSMGWAAVDEQRAWQEIEKLFSAQWADGMVPQIVFHKESPTYFPGPEIWGSVEQPRPTTGITQPPVAATAVRQLLERGISRGGPALRLSWQRAQELFPKLLAYHNWFSSARDPEGTGLVATIHPWESGMDNSPAWDLPLARVPVDDIPKYTRRDLGHVDAAMRPQQAEYDRFLTLVYRFRAADYDPARLYGLSPFRVTDVCTNAVLHRANLDLRWLAISLGKLDAVPQIDSWLDKSGRAFGLLWDEEKGLFLSQDQITGEPLEAATSAGFLPLYARTATPQQAAVMAATMERWISDVQYAVPSLDPRDSRFEPLRYWRGPVWAIVNYMLVDGLRWYGYEDLAGRIEGNTRQLMNEHGLYEYYNPVTGAGAGGPRFSWTAAMALAWLDKPNADVVKRPVTVLAASNVADAAEPSLVATTGGAAGVSVEDRTLVLAGNLTMSVHTSPISEAANAVTLTL